jgi:hypothetical protein
LSQGVLKVESISMEAEINRKDSKRWSLNAAIPGDPNQVTDVINQIAQQLYWNGIGSVFEVYNDSFEKVLRPCLTTSSSSMIIVKRI